MNASSLLPTPTWFVGCGNMGSAIIDGWRASALDLSSIVVIRPSGTPIAGTRTVTSFGEAGFPPKLVVPNLPVAVRRGVVALYSEDAEDSVRQQLADLFAPLAFGIWMNAESNLAAVGSVAGAGPAYVARFIDALAKAGEERGLSREVAATIALETVLGTAWLAATTGETMEDIARRVASPRGTTEAGLAVLDHDRVLEQLIGVTIQAAAQRGAELAQEAKAASLEEPARLS
jgi:pyrroline-5-carboxylate reductase